MPLKKGFMLRNIAGNYVVIPLGERVVDFNGILTLNETGAFIWDLLLQEKNLDNITKAVISEFDVDEPIAKSDIEEFMSYLEEHSLLEECGC